LDVDAAIAKYLYYSLLQPRNNMATRNKCKNHKTSLWYKFTSREDFL